MSKEEKDLIEQAEGALSAEGSGKDSIEAARARSEVTGTAEDATDYENGFTIKTIIGALFIGFIMMPGAMYMGLVAGQGLGPAAQWVTIVLFAEVARRSFAPLKRAEIYTLFYVAGGLTGMAGGGPGLAGGPFAGFIWNQYFVQSPQAAHIAQDIPQWIVPAKGSEALLNRTFFHTSWLIPISLLLVGEILGRLNWIGGGYVLFRLTSDVERLPFPLAPVAAAGATALAEAGSKEESWRWQVFSTGTVLGLIFGAIYLFIPVVSGVVLAKPIMLLPIPFVDFTVNTEKILPATPMGLDLNLGALLIGFVLPFPIVFGSIIGVVVFQIIGNPILYKFGMMPTWREGMGTITTQMAASLDFWLSAGIGIGVAVGLIGLGSVVRSAIKMRGRSERERALMAVPKNRGDFSIWLGLGMWLFATAGYIVLSKILVPDFPFAIILFFGLIWTPLISYVNARMTGLTGQQVNFPFLREAVYIKSGYSGTDIWFAPIPIGDLGATAQRFREMELAKTRFTSIYKAEVLMLPTILIASFIFWQFFWHTSQIPSAQYPYANRFWPLQATMQSIWLTANRVGEENFLLQALKPEVIVAGGLATFALYGVCVAVGIPLLMFYGIIGGMQGLIHTALPTFLGAMLGRYYFAKKFGAGRWSMYAPVLLAGFSCGMGLTGMSGIAVALIAKSINYLPF